MSDPRRSAVLASALETFARDGYRRTSMDAVATAAGLSRPGLYFLFGSKEALFREASAFVLAQDLATVADLLGDEDHPLGERLLSAFDRWAGRWIGPQAQDVPGVVAANPLLLDATARNAPAVFERLVTAALSGHVDDPVGVARTLLSVSVGLKHQVDTRVTYRRRLGTAIGLLLR